MIGPVACPLCGRDMHPASNLAASGRVAYWSCPDRTCTGILSELEARPRRDDLLGADTEDLMRPAVTPTKGRGGARGRKSRARGLRGAVRAGYRERRYLSQDAAPCGGRDRPPVEERKPVLLRLPRILAAWLEGRAEAAGLSVTALVVALVAGASVAPCCPACDLPTLSGASPLCACGDQGEPCECEGGEKP